jgi:potassium channel LctB
MVLKHLKAIGTFRGIEKTFFRKLLFDRPFLKFSILIVVQYLILYFTRNFPEKTFIDLVLTTISIFIAIYFVSVIYYVVKRTIEKLKNPQNLTSLIAEYSLFVLGIILIFSSLFSFVQTFGLGAIKYDGCSDIFDPAAMSTDNTISRDYFYFTAITFLAVGYGDICPMGLSKILAIITSFIGHLISGILVAIIINNYIRLREQKKQ